MSNAWLNAVNIRTADSNLSPFASNDRLTLARLQDDLAMSIEKWRCQLPSKILSGS
jgi:hypothetical protein